MNRVLPLRLSRTATTAYMPFATVSGLLAQASFYDGDTLTRKVTVSELSTETPDRELFTLPDDEALYRKSGEWRLQSGETAKPFRYLHS